MDLVGHVPWLPAIKYLLINEKKKKNNYYYFPL